MIGFQKAQAWGHAFAFSELFLLGSIPSDRAERTIDMPTTQEKAVSRKEAAIAKILGKPAYGAIDWRLLMKQGSLVRLTIRRCGFTAKLELFDLGVTVNDERVRQALSRTLVLGEKRLLPESYMRELARITGAARHLLKKCTFALSPELGAFLPASAYATFKKKIQELSTAYFNLRDEILANYRPIVQEVLDEYAILAKDTYQRITETRLDALEESEREFAAKYLARIESLIPTPEKIKTSFDFFYSLTNGVKLIGDEEGSKPAQRQEEDLTTALPLPAEWSQEATDWEYQRSAMMRDMLLQEQKQKKESIDNFLGSVAAQLRSLIYEVVTDVLATLQQRQRKDGKFSGRSVVQLKNLVKQVSMLNFYGDEEVDRLMAQVQRIIGQRPSDRAASLLEIQKMLRAIATVSRVTLLNLEKEPRSARELAISDVPAEGAVREARIDLGLDLQTAEFLKKFETRPERIYNTPSLWSTGGLVLEREARMA